MNAQKLSHEKQDRVVRTLPFVEALARRIVALARSLSAFSRQ